MTEFDINVDETPDASPKNHRNAIAAAQSLAVLSEQVRTLMEHVAVLTNAIAGKDGARHR